MFLCCLCALAALVWLKIVQWLGQTQEDLCDSGYTILVVIHGIFLPLDSHFHFVVYWRRGLSLSLMVIPDRLNTWLYPYQSLSNHLGAALRAQHLRLLRVERVVYKFGTVLDLLSE